MPLATDVCNIKKVVTYVLTSGVVPMIALSTFSNSHMLAMHLLPFSLEHGTDIVETEYDMFSCRW